MGKAHEVSSNTEAPPLPLSKGGGRWESGNHWVIASVRDLPRWNPINCREHNRSCFRITTVREFCPPGDTPRRPDSIPSQVIPIILPINSYIRHAFHFTTKTVIFRSVGHCCAEQCSLLRIVTKTSNIHYST